MEYAVQVTVQGNGLLFVTSESTKYYVVSSGQSDFYIELLNSTNGLNIDFIDTIDEVEYNGEYHVRIIVLDSGSMSVQHQAQVPTELAMLNNDQVSAVRFRDNTVLYYVKRGDQWYVEGGDEGSWTPLVGAGGERDAATYAALFAGNAETYRCNMMKAFKRLSLVSQVLQDKVDLMMSSFEGSATDSACLSVLNTQATVYRELSMAAKQCTSSYLACSESDLLRLKDSIFTLNQELSAQGVNVSTKAQMQMMESLVAMFIFILVVFGIIFFSSTNR